MQTMSEVDSSGTSDFAPGVLIDPPIALGPPSVDELLEEHREVERIQAEAPSPAEVTQVLTEVGPDANYRIRINVTKNTKGYQYETTVEVAWSGEEHAGIDPLTRLCAAADMVARREVENRELLDKGEQIIAEAVAAKVEVPPAHNEVPAPVAESIDDLPF